MVFTGICLSAYLHDISQTDAPKITILNMQCSVMSPGNQFILGSKRQGHVTEKQCRRESLHSCECWLIVAVLLCCVINVVVLVV